MRMGSLAKLAGGCAEIWLRTTGLHHLVSNFFFFFFFFLHCGDNVLLDVLPPWRSVIEQAGEGSRVYPKTGYPSLPARASVLRAERSGQMCMPRPSLSNSYRGVGDDKQPPLMVVSLVQACQRLPSRSRRINGHRSRSRSKPVTRDHIVECLTAAPWVFIFRSPSLWPTPKMLSSR